METRYHDQNWYRIFPHILENKMMVLSAPGLRLQEDENENVEEEKISFVAKKIIEEIKAIPYDKTLYRKSIGNDIVSEDTSSSLSKLLSCISPNLQEKSLPSIFIGNIVSSKVVRRSSSWYIGEREEDYTTHV